MSQTGAYVTQKCAVEAELRPVRGSGHIHAKRPMPGDIQAARRRALAGAAVELISVPGNFLREGPNRS